jgi:lysophospholipase L1-like esterase
MANSNAVGSGAPRTGRGASLRAGWQRMLLALSLVAAGVAVMAFAPMQSRAASAFVGPSTYYLGLGDSLAFGYEPNLDWSHGYVQQWYTNLKSHGVTSLTNYGCNGETSSTFINGGCPYWYLRHNQYSGSQLNAAVNFIKGHAGHVSPVSLDMGANDVLPDISSSCTVSSKWTTDLATMDTNLSQTILPKLINALKNSSGAVTGDLVMMNYYNPFAIKCANYPAVVADMATVNSHLANDWTAGWQNAGFSAPPYGLADVYTAFGGSNQAVCTDTWMCSSYADIHATGGQSGEPGNGYGAIAGAFQSLTGY